MLGQFWRKFGRGEADISLRLGEVLHVVRLVVVGTVQCLAIFYQDRACAVGEEEAFMGIHHDRV